MARHQFVRSRLLDAEHLSRLALVTLHFVVCFVFCVPLVLPVFLVRHLIGSHLVVFHHAVAHLVIVLHGLRTLLSSYRGDACTNNQGGDKDRGG
jgi:hypothetical protein